MEKAHQVLSKLRVISSSIILTIAELQASKHMNPTFLLVHWAVCCNQTDLGLELALIFSPSWIITCRVIVVQEVQLAQKIVSS
jgi:hypothetical protein